MRWRVLSIALGLHPLDAISTPTLSAVTTINVSRSCKILLGEVPSSQLKTTCSDKEFFQDRAYVPGMSMGPRVGAEFLVLGRVCAGSAPSTFAVHCFNVE